MALADDIGRARVGDVELAYLACGDGPLVLCVHGFPDTAHSFTPVMQGLAASGYRAVAPFLRGYAPSGLAADGDYRLTTVADDLIGLIGALGERQAFVVGHDWGAAASYVAAARAPDRVRAIVTAAVPHLRRFLLRPTLRQLARSRYMAYFQLRRIPEARIVRDDFAWLRALIRRWSPGWDCTDADLAPVFATLSQPAHCSAALAYYRALPRALADREAWRLLFAPLPVPAKVICGADDGCIGVEMFEDQARYFGAGFELVRFDGAGHFMHCEQPQRFADEVISFLSQCRQ
ncbi:alpha/beta fold hydrolase [Sinimarinibacterium flocculans]|uniref:Pimeloyl-ACP methyl ester carboxylesterase n=1 Tax=Sinimarinibacterium flocculans TaxID=985250 RepID=A0A318EAK6_9GAMM|nr:alpha/beta hydrolase [Sinimarinibacterium flocculans]PXV69553.1 pimeloyl-ACP methyl ester carboxylesterase [Sinimarinibacterium flocculans]